ncbi:MAG: YbjN domain-containing protein [Holosporaceae bacterium]|nr:YbjN domain-containing protein [Holosporaceae bacterium]
MLVLVTLCRRDRLNVNPIDITEILATKKNLYFNRVDDNEISILLKSEKPEYVLSVIFRSDYEIIHFSCDVNLRVPKKKRLVVTDAIVKANERIWVGHFDLISADNCIVYSFTIPFVSSFSVDEDTIESIIQLVKDECNRFYCYFSMIIENRGLSEASLNSLFLEISGEA